jgi:hypothetical protein
MLSPALAIAWTLWRRHRWGLILVLSYVAVLITTASLLPMTILGPQTVSAILGPMTLLLIILSMYLLAVFSYGFDADVSGGESCFPASLFRLPVGTGTLALWPMAYGAAAAVLLWLATALFILRPWMGPWDVAVPLWWPAMLAVAAQAWIQALLWWPVGLPGLRVILTALMIPGLIAVAGKGVTSGASEGSLACLLAGCAGVAWGVGYVGVRQARRGGLLNWEWALWPLRRLACLLTRRRQPFGSAQASQVWFEWRRSGRSLLVVTGLVMPFALWPLLLGKNSVISLAQTLLGSLAIPLFFAGLVGTTVSGNHPWVKDYYGVAPFNATLPMATAGLVAARLKSAARSVLATWVLVAVMMAGGLALTGNLQEAAGWWRRGVDELGLVKTGAGIVAALTLLVVWTWKHLVDSLFLGLTGRKWVINVSIFLSMAGFVGLWICVAWYVSHPDYQETFLAILPWLLLAFILGKLTAAGWALHQTVRQGLLASRTVLGCVACWLVLASVLIGLLTWVVPLGPVPAYYLGFGVLFAMPMVRLAATPVALAWNRHR